MCKIRFFCTILQAGRKLRETKMTGKILREKIFWENRPRAKFNFGKMAKKSETKLGTQEKRLEKLLKAANFSQKICIFLKKGQKDSHKVISIQSTCPPGRGSMPYEVSIGDADKKNSCRENRGVGT